MDSFTLWISNFKENDPNELFLLSGAAPSNLMLVTALISSGGSFANCQALNIVKMWSMKNKKQQYLFFFSSTRQQYLS